MPEQLLQERAAPATEMLTRRMPVNASTWNAETRHFDVTFATPRAPVDRWDRDGAYVEILDVKGCRLREGVVHFLDNHRRDSIDGILGAIVSASAVSGEARATVRLSRHHPSAVRMAGDLSDGQSFGISVGYVVTRWIEARDQKTGVRTKTAADWVVYEVSAANIPADALATTRGGNLEPEGNPSAQPANPASQPVITPAPVPASQPAPVTGRSDASQVQTRAQINGEIRTIGRASGLTQTAIDHLIDNGASVEDARRSAMDEIVRRSNAAPTATPGLHVGIDHTDLAVVSRHMGEALYTRVNRSHNPSEPARRFAHFSMMDHARECLRMRSVPASGLSGPQLIERALHTTSDFPLILGDAVNRTLRDSYRVATSSLKALGRQVNATDFRTRHRLQLSEGPELEKLGESGEIKAGSLVEAEETYKLATYAKRLGISRQIIVNDDLGAFADIGRRMGQGAAVTEAKLLVALLEANAGGGPKMADGKNLFHADHGNLAAGGNSPWITANPGFEAVLTDARLAMRRQKTLKGNPAPVTPASLIVPPEGETIAEKTLTAIAAAKASDANPFAGKLTLVVEPYLTNARPWFLAANPAEIDGLEWSYLEGEEGPQTEARAGWEIEGVEIKTRLDFGAGFVDTRGWYRNGGTPV